MSESTTPFTLAELARLVNLVGGDAFASALEGRSPEARALIAKCRAIVLAGYAGERPSVTWAERNEP